MEFSEDSIIYTFLDEKIIKAKVVLRWSTTMASWYECLYYCYNDFCNKSLKVNSELAFSTAEEAVAYQVISS